MRAAACSQRTQLEEGKFAPLKRIVGQTVLIGKFGIRRCSSCQAQLFISNFYWHVSGSSSLYHSIQVQCYLPFHDRSSNIHVVTKFSLGSVSGRKARFCLPSATSFCMSASLQIYAGIGLVASRRRFNIRSRHMNEINLNQEEQPAL